jgi:four helix bundle protein
MTKQFDLEARTTEFAKAVVRLCMQLPRNPINDRLIGQVVGASGSVGANYREANNSVGDKDFVMRMKISRREAKESQHWLEIILEANKNKEIEISALYRNLAN